MASATGVLDEAVKEYLVYRGFTSTLRYFELEKRDDKDKGFKVSRIVDHIVQCVTRSDFTSLQTFWVYLNKRFFSRLSHDSLMTVYRLETSILRLFLVYATRQNKQDIVRDFFDKMSDALHDKKEWKDWFALPFSKNPEQHPSFKLYFSKEWADAFFVTLHNFFSTLFACLPLPTLLNFEAEHQKMQVLATENHHLQMHLATTRQALADAESTIQKLEAKLGQQEAKYAQQLANQAAPKRNSYIAKAPGRSVSTKRVQSPKKPVVKSTSLNEQSRDLLEQVAGPNKQQGLTFEDLVAKKRDMSLKITNKKPEAVPDILSPITGIDDIGLITPYPNSDGSTPFFLLNHESYKGHSAPITHCKFSPNASNIATVDTDGVLKVWDPSDLHTTATLELKPSLLSLDWAPQSNHLVVVGSGGGMVQLFDCNTNRLHWSIASEQHYPKILSIACSNSSSTLAFSAASSASTPLSSSSYLNRSYALASPSLPSSRHTSNEMVQLNMPLNMDPSRHPHEVPPGAIYIYDLKTQQKKCSLPMTPNPVSINCMAFNHNCSLLITGASDGMIRLFDVAQQEYLFGWRAHNYSDVFNVQFSSDETSVYSMGCDKRFCQWSINRSGDMLVEFAVHEGACQPTEGILKDMYYPSIPPGNLFAFENEDKFVLTCAPDQAIVYQGYPEIVPNNTLLSPKRPPQQPSNQAYLSALVPSASKKLVVEGGSLLKMLSIMGHSGPVTCVDWLHGSRSISTCITGSVDNTVKITNLLKTNK